MTWANCTGKCLRFLAFQMRRKSSSFLMRCHPLTLLLKTCVSCNKSQLRFSSIKTTKSHIAVHMAAIQDPKIQQLVGQSPFALQYKTPCRHTSLSMWLCCIVIKLSKKLGVSMPDEDAPLPEDVELELSRVAKQAAETLLGKNQAEVQATASRRATGRPVDSNTAGRTQNKTRRASAQNYYGHGEAWRLDKLSKMANMEVSVSDLIVKKARETKLASA